MSQQGLLGAMVRILGILPPYFWNILGVMTHFLNFLGHLSMQLGSWVGRCFKSVLHENHRKIFPDLRVDLGQSHGNFLKAIYK